MPPQMEVSVPTPQMQVTVGELKMGFALLCGRNRVSIIVLDTKVKLNGLNVKI